MNEPHAVGMEERPVTESVAKSGQPTVLLESQEQDGPVESAFQLLVRDGASARIDGVALTDEQRIALFRRALGSGNIKATIGVLERLKMSAEPPFTDELLAVLTSKTERLRMKALDVIGSSKRKALAAAVALRLNDELPEVRATACDTLRALDSSTPAILKMLFGRLSDSSTVVRAACADTFARDSQSQVMRNDVGALLLGNSSAGCEGGLRVLASWGTSADFDLIRGRLADEREAIVVSALAAVSRFATVAAIRELERFIKDSRESVRIEAVAGLERQRADLVKNSVYQALADTASSVRIAAAAQLTRYPTDPETFIRLHALLRDESAGVRSSTAMALFELANARSFRPVAERLEREPSPEVRVDLWRTLAVADPSAAVPLLINALGNTEKEEKSAVLIALRQVTGQVLDTKPSTWRDWRKTQATAVVKPAAHSAPP